MRTNELGEAEPESNDDVGYINDIIKARKEGAREELERKHRETLKIIWDWNKSFKQSTKNLIEVLELAQKERLKELGE
jgi:hypothetical protein